MQGINDLAFGFQLKCCLVLLHGAADRILLSEHWTMDRQKWIKAFTKAGIASESAETYADIFVTEKLMWDNLALLDRPLLKELGVGVLGDILTIMGLSKGVAVPQASQSLIKAPVARPPQLHSEMTPQQFRKFVIDWEVFVEMTNLPKAQFHNQLYSCASESVQNAIINTHGDFFDKNSDDLLDIIKNIVTQKSNPLVHRMTFAGLSQGQTESIQNYRIRLKSLAQDCDFSCPKCKHDLSEIYIKDQMIRGLDNETLQTDILAKAESLTSLDTVVKHAEAFEAALRDQAKLSDVAAARLSGYARKKRTQITAPARNGAPPKSQSATAGAGPRINRVTCAGCGSSQHGAFDRASKCPAWGKTCVACGRTNHFARVCRSSYTQQSQAGVRSLDSLPLDDIDSAQMDALIAHVTFDQHSGHYTATTVTDNVEEIDAVVIPFSPEPDPPLPDNIPSVSESVVRVFPNSGATICLGGLSHLNDMGFSTDNLIPSQKVVRTVGNFTLVCRGWLPVRFIVEGKETKQALYICDKVDRIYFSKGACVDVGILSPVFPHPMSCAESELSELHSAIPPVGTAVSACQPQPSVKLPVRPQCPPYPPTEENVTKLKEWLLDEFVTTAFNNEGEFPFLSGPDGRIHLREDAVPRARHAPIPVPFHFKEAVKAGLFKDIERGIIAPVPAGTPTEWCSTMVITPKKDGRPRRTVDYQYLNTQCKRETHYTGTPLHLALQVPAQSRKTVLDAVDGYHSVPLDEESQLLTTFITEWGQYMYRRMPQGFLASGDAYTRRYDDIIRDVPRVVKIVDDALLYDETIEGAFFHTFDYLTLGAQNGIVFNKSKFQFCQENVDFGGLRLTPDGIAPSATMLMAIQDFPTPANITDARSWFGLVNQVAWAYSLGHVMQPFRELVKPNSKFQWSQSLEDAFQYSKSVIVDLVKEGITTFDINRKTCLAPDWSKQGMGFLLLQKYCDCPDDKAPTCCPDGWRLVFAGSRVCTSAESRYAPIEGEASAIAWSLDKCRMFVLGCQDLIVTTDHEPLKGIFGDRDLSKVANPRLFRLKERTLWYRFRIQHRQGKWHRGSDAMSRNPATAVRAVMQVCLSPPTSGDLSEADNVESYVRSSTVEAMSEYGDDLGAISPDMIRAAGRADQSYMALSDTIEAGFPGKRNLLNPEIREFWEVRNRLSADDGLILMDNRIVVPLSHRKRVLRCLHSAHQGVIGMKARANVSVYWPGMDASIRNFHASCRTCSTIAPSLPREPIVMTPSPDYPFQRIVMDVCEVQSHLYLVCADRLTGWLMIFHLKPGHATSMELISICRTLFHTYGSPEELSSDGGSIFMSHAFQNFLETWGVRHRLSSVAYPQSNGRAELAVKSAKRIIYGNTDASGSLDTDKAAQAVLQYRNTPIQGIGLSPAQLLLHRHLRDFVPAQPCLYRPHPEWLKASLRRETLLAKRNAKLIEDYDRTAHTLPPLNVGTYVALQDPHNRRWNRTGRIVEALADRQYRVRVDGSGRITLRNRRFLKLIQSKVSGTFIPSAMPPPPVPVPPTTHNPHVPLAPSPSTSHSRPLPPVLPPSVAHGPSMPAPPRAVPSVPRALSRLAPHNQPGRQELLPAQRPGHGGRGGGDIE